VTQPLEIVIFNSAGNTFSGTAGLTKIGPGWFRLGAGNSYEGRTKVLGGNLQFPTDDALGLAPGDFVPDQFVLDGGEIQPNGNPITFATTRGITIGAGGGIFNNSSTSITVNSPISGPGAIQKIGGNNLTLGAANTFNGLTLTNGRTDFTVSDSAGIGTITINPLFPTILS